MKALAIIELGRRAQLIELPCPTPAAGEVLIRTQFSGVSMGTEMAIAGGLRTDYGPPPFVIGYQAVGEVIQTGVGVTNCRAGEAVAVYCRGAHREFITTQSAWVHPLVPAPARPEMALFVQPSVATHALNQAEIAPGNTVLVIGQGLIGQCAAALARLRGATVVACDVAPARLEMSRRFCADEVFDASGLSISAATRVQRPDGFDVVLESTGLNRMIDDAMGCCRLEGKFVFLGWYPGKISFDFMIPHQKQLRAFFPSFIGPPAVREMALRLLASGALPMKEMISHLVSAAEAGAIYNELLTGDQARFNGIVIDWR